MTMNDQQPYRRRDLSEHVIPSIQQRVPTTSQGSSTQFPQRAVWEEQTRPMPAQRNSHQQTQLAQFTIPPPTPPQFSPAQRHKRRRIGIPLLITILLLVILVTIGGLIEQHLFEGTISSALPTKTAGPTGPFVQLPLSSIQIDSLHHLVGHMQYKQLASLYVSRMSLDEELGQLIMVEYGDTYYSSDLDMMVNQLHAGGVIMYEFQMQTFNQTKNDIAQMQKNAKIPLLISADEEGGIVHRLIHIYPPRPSALSIYETGNPAVAAAQGHLVAHDLLALGINENLT